MHRVTVADPDIIKRASEVSEQTHLSCSIEIVKRYRFGWYVCVRLGRSITKAWVLLRMHTTNYRQYRPQYLVRLAARKGTRSRAKQAGENLYYGNSIIL